MMKSIPGVPSMSNVEKEGCNIEDTITWYEAIQFSYFDEKKKLWLDRKRDRDS